MKKAITFKVGQIVENRHGHFAKIIALKNGFVHFAGWSPKKKTAEEAEGATAFLNQFGLARAMGDSEVITQTGESLTGDDTSTGEGEGDDSDVDPFDGVTVQDMKDALKEDGLPTSGTRDELIARCKENGIEFETEEETA